MRLLALVLVGIVGLEAAPRKKVALALEGGSASGLAHIGVLEWMEEHRIPIDAIAGTSMGGLVGGLYATGRSPAELREIVKNAPWDQLLGGAMAFRDLSFRRREDRSEYPNLLELGLKHGLSLPGGLNTGHQIGLLLSRWTLAYPELDSFDALPTPFRCVATNLVSGEEEVFSKGVLADALRATMSLPGAFKPTKRNGKLYVDGALLQNLPVDVARQMGADIVIAVHLAKPATDPKSLQAIPGVLGRSLEVMISANELRSMERADLVVTVELAGFTGTDYPRSAELAEAGKRAAEKKRNILEAFALPEAEWRDFQRERAGRRRADPAQVSTLRVEAEDPRQADSIRQNLEQFVAKPLDTGALETELTRTAGAGRQAALRYSVNGRELRVQAEERSYGPPFLVPTVEIDGSDIENFRISVGGRMTWMGVGRPRAEWRNDILVGSRYRLASEYWVPFGERSRFFVAPRVFAGDTTFPIYVDTTQAASYRLREAGVGLEMGYQFGRSAELRVGHTTSWLAARRRIGLSLLPNFSYRADVPGARFRYLNFDDPIVPREGGRVEANFGYVLTRGPQMELQATGFRRTGKNGSVFGGVAGGTAFSTRSLELGSFSLGGPLRLPAYATNELLGNQYWLGTTGYLRELRPGLSILGTRLYVATWAQMGKMYGPQGYAGVVASGAGAVLVRTFLGPVYVGGAYGDRGHGRVFVGVGRFF